MEPLFERLGYLAQWVSDTAAGAAREASAAGRGAYEWAEEWAEEVADDPEDADTALSVSAASIATTLLALAGSRWLEPRDVDWPRAAAAGIVGTALYDLTMIVDQRAFGQELDTVGPLGEALSDDPEMQKWLAWASHYAAGVALGVLYARYLSARLPGPPILRGIAFGVLDVATLAWGGVYPLLQQSGAGLGLPAGYAALAHAPSVTAQSLLRHVAYGAGLGLVYGDPEG